MVMELRCASIATSWAAAAAAIPRSAALSLTELCLIGIDFPQIMLEQGGGQETGRRAASSHYSSILPLPDMAHPERSVLNMPGPAPAERFVAKQRGLNRTFAREAFGENQ